MSDERSSSLYYGPPGTPPEELLKTVPIPVNNVKFHYREYHGEMIPFAPVKGRGEFKLNIHIDWTGFEEALKRCTEALRELSRAVRNGGPLPLCIDGHEYRRRQRNRRRR